VVTLSLSLSLSLTLTLSLSLSLTLTVSLSLTLTLTRNCYVDDVADCVPTVHVQRLDLSEFSRGFSYEVADHYTQAPTDPP